MSIAGSGGVLLAPPTTVQARYGLLSVAEVEDRPETQGHWQLGYSQDRGPCQDEVIIVTACAPQIEDKSGAAVGIDTFDGDPFTLVTGYKCSTGGRTTLSEAFDIAERRMLRGESRALERAFWTGRSTAGDVIRQTLRDNPEQTADDLTPAGGALSITDGVAVLESYMGDCYPLSPIIHANRGVATYLAERNLVERNSDMLLMSGTGTRVAVGGGYQSTGPDGTVPANADEGWLIATGAVKVLRSPVFFTPERGDVAASIDRAINDQTVFAERTYGFMLDCCIAAVRVTMKTCCSC